MTQPADGRNHLWGTFIDEGGNTGLLAAASATCTVEVAPKRVRAGGFTARVTIRNSGTEPLDLGALSWHAGSGEAVLRASGAAVSQNGTRVEIAPEASTLKPGGARTFVITGTANAEEISLPTDFVLDGVECER